MTRKYFQMILTAPLIVALLPVFAPLWLLCEIGAGYCRWYEWHFGIDIEGNPIRKQEPRDAE